MEIQDQMIVGEEEILIKDLYYVLMKCGYGNVKKCKELIKHHHVYVNNHIIDDICFQVTSLDEIKVNDEKLSWPFVYYMMNKPKGYICARLDKQWPCVIDLLDEKDCYCVGRLDKDTTGLLILTNDVSLSKKLLLPQNHVEKTYLVRVDQPLKENLILLFRKGIVIDDHVLCQSAKLEISDSYHCYVTIHEGKYHQVKKMFLSCGYRVVQLKRVCFAEIELDERLCEGDYRSLTFDEFQKLEKLIKDNQREL